MTAFDANFGERLAVSVLALNFARCATEDLSLAEERLMGVVLELLLEHLVGIFLHRVLELAKCRARDRTCRSFMESVDGQSKENHIALRLWE